KIWCQPRRADTKNSVIGQTRKRESSIYIYHNRSGFRIKSGMTVDLSDTTSGFIRYYELIGLLQRNYFKGIIQRSRSRLLHACTG
ncbi:MAG: hypothetical protein P9M15_03090, partial [Candidatus Electryoneaceae bacterium]|nr:hypothetical protein [Candidatus Electryoneaceae bacterium]